MEQKTLPILADKECVDPNFLNLRSFLLSVSISYVIYSIFYHYSSLIWITKRSISLNDIVPNVRIAICDEGLEAYVLYAASFLNIFLTIILDKILYLFKQKRIVYLTFFIFLICAINYFSKIPFRPPYGTIGKIGIPLLVFVSAVFITTNILVYLNKRYSCICNIVVIVACVPICFIAIGPISPIDYSYIFAPALRLLHGFSLSKIFFQYDFLLSFLAAIWMKLNLNLNLFQVIGQAGTYVFIVGLFLFSKKIFNDKKLPAYLLISLILTRHYALERDPVVYLQNTPLRLDLWLPILIFVYFKGIYNWTVGVMIGLLVLAHRNFGVIYLVSYCQFIFFLFVMDLIEERGKININLRILKEKILKHLLLIRVNFLIVVFFILLSAVLFNGFALESAVIFQRLGIAFLRVPEKSFYWYVPILFSLSALLFLRYRKDLPENYFNTGFLLLILAIGSSLYFLGRSHPHNILNLSGIFMFLLFFLFDLLGRRLSLVKVLDRAFIIKRALIFSSLVIFLFMLAYSYSTAALIKIKTQFQNLIKSKFTYPLPIQPDLKTIDDVTNSSKKVYFLSMIDTYYYYYGKYIPLGYFSPYPAWTIKKELIGFLQKLLDSGYYLVIDFSVPVDELLPELRFNKRVEKNQFLFITNLYK